MSEQNHSSYGTRFVRADLHIHSYGPEKGSFDVEDTSMTPKNIIDTAISKNLSIISITDHNEIENVKVALDYAVDKPILVIPGVEVSTTQGHLLVYFPDYSSLQNFRHRLNISVDKERCTQSIVDCLNLADEFGGIGVLAHIELSSGFERTIARYGPQMEDVVCHPNLWGMEISKKDNLDFFTDSDGSDDRKRLIRLRREKLELDKDFDFPKIMSSDAHTLTKLGTNADGANKLTRLKLDSLDFHSFKIALLYHKSRVRIEDFIPEHIPRFTKIQVEGGLLANQVVNISQNLTCIIGGRGAGKSTLLESLRECSGNNSKSKVVDSEVWPEKISLSYVDEAGQHVNLCREKNSSIYNEDNPEGIIQIPIESYGQGDTANIIQHSDKNPESLLKFLDPFVDVEALKQEDKEIRQLLMDNQSNANKLRVEIAGIPETRKQKKNLEGKIAKLKKDKVGDLVSKQTALHQEREIRKEIKEDLNGLYSKYKDILSDSSVFDEFKKLSDEDIIVGKNNFSKVKRIVADFAKIVSEKSGELSVALKEKIETLKIEITLWASNERKIQDEIDIKKKELEEQGIPFDMGKINQLAKDLTYYQSRLKQLLQKNENLNNLLIERKELLKKRVEIKDKIFYLRQNFANKINDNLKNALDGFFVNVKFYKGTLAPQFEDSLKNMMNWHTIQHSKAKYIGKVINPIDFVRAIQKKNLDLLRTIKDEDNKKVFSDSEIAKILERCWENFNFEDFESVEFEDTPKITVTKMVKGEDGETKTISRNLAQLSLGQQQSILLAILMQSKSRVPLVIDQPEDNLDSEFIYKTIVSTLRRIKESRQVIIVTHNANIAVLGDAELIVPLKSTNTNSFIIDSGSIDNEMTRKLTCEVLEGGTKAFVRRKEIYGI